MVSIKEKTIKSTLALLGLAKLPALFMRFQPNVFEYDVV